MNTWHFMFILSSYYKLSLRYSIWKSVVSLLKRLPWPVDQKLNWIVPEKSVTWLQIKLESYSLFFMVYWLSWDHQYFCRTEGFKKPAQPAMAWAEKVRVRTISGTNLWNLVALNYNQLTARLLFLNLKNENGQ